MELLYQGMIFADRFPGVRSSTGRRGNAVCFFFSAAVFSAAFSAFSAASSFSAFYDPPAVVFSLRSCAMITGKGFSVFPRHRKEIFPCSPGRMDERGKG